MDNTTADHQFNCSLNNNSLRVPLAVFYSLFFLLGLVGNLLALWVFLKMHAKKNSFRIFLINLALADLLLISCLPFRIFYHANNEHWNLQPVICRMVGSIFYMNMYVSIVLLGLISIDRYLKLQRVSSRQRFLSSRQSILTCCIVWFVAIVWVAPLIFSAGNKTQSQKCFHYKRLQHTKWKAYLNIGVVLLFWVVYSALIKCYGKIAVGMLQVSKEKPDLPNAVKYSQTAQKSFFILFLFTVCFVPYHLVRIFYIISQITEVSCRWIQVLDKTNEIALMLSAFNSCLDPVMYFLLCSSIRKAVLQMLQKSCCMYTYRHSSNSSTE
ncbi:probable G-protein coupled receptor 34 [Trichomycterus rosablanca]|uniref:probable G-protein coupled receptor 34 n=1 Tax=Trichomycterus rosablanca TaxID=2290929 RepID=UPI002F34F7EA